MTQTVFTVKISEKLKKEMGEIDVNWSEYFLDCLQEKVDQHKIKAASDKIDEVRECSKPTFNKEILAWIREDRERQAFDVHCCIAHQGLSLSFC